MEHIDLGNTAVGELKELAVNKELHSLKINGTQIKDADLGELRTLKKLAVLDISGDNISNIGIKRLAGLQLPIVALYLRETLITTS